MAAINKISAGAQSVFNTCVKNPMLNLQKSNFMQKGYEAYRNDKQSFMNWAGILSIVAKDGLGCVMYVWQSLNNKNIPDDKRTGVTCFKKVCIKKTKHTMRNKECFVFLLCRITSLRPADG